MARPFLFYVVLFVVIFILGMIFKPFILGAFGFN